MTERAQGWRLIETIDGEDWRKRMFWLDWADDCKSLNQPIPDEHKLFIGRYRSWSSLYRATHWRPMVEGPRADGEKADKS